MNEEYSIRELFGEKLAQGYTAKEAREILELDDDVNQVALKEFIVELNKTKNTEIEMRISKSDLDTPFSVLIDSVKNTETPREFIRNSEAEFGIPNLNIDTMDDGTLNAYIEDLDYLWEK